MNLKELHKPFPPAEIEWRVGSTTGDKTKGLALAYLTARHVMERLDEVCGPHNWQDRYEFHGGRTVCYLSIKIGDEWITKADGAGDSDVEAEKGAISDALKRAAVKWGVGRYLYDLGQTWVQIEPAGRSFRIKREEYGRLQQSLANQFGGEVPQQPAPAQEAPPTLSKAKSRDLFKELQAELDDCATVEKLAAVWLRPAFQAEFKKLPADWSKMLTDHKDDLKAALQGGPSDGGYVPPQFDKEPA